MSMQIPQKILLALDELTAALSNSKKVIGYKFLIGNPQNAHCVDFDDAGWNSSDAPVKYNRHQGTTWFRFDVKIPVEVMDIPVEGSSVRLSSQFTAPIDVYVDGTLRFSEKTWMDFKNPEIILTDHAVPGQLFKVAVKLELGESCYFSGTCSMNWVIEAVDDLEFEISSFRQELVYAANFEEVNSTLPEVCKTIAECLENKEGVQKLIEKIRYSRENLRPMEAAAKNHTVHLIGHAHIDMNWFWSMEETHDLIRRDFGTMAAIMEEIPAFKFSQSQCACYEMAEKLYPQIFKKMKRFIKSGNWDVTASTWVEGDLNMSSGESIVRHILYSKKYLKEKFNIEPKIMWCPDTFGHSGNVPQICKKAGIPYYYFMRCGKQYNLPNDSKSCFFQDGAESPIFWWEGIDGSRVLAYNSSYNADTNTDAILKISTKLQEKNSLANSMFVYGTGDHGGGPARRDIKRAQQLASYPTMPAIEFSTTHTFFDSVVKEKSSDIGVEKGELNFVFDGCYTTHSNIKSYNRKCENMLVGTEALAVICNLYGLPYDKGLFEECWHAALFNQFHDIFDGSGVSATYDYSTETAEKTLNSLTTANENYMSWLGARIKKTGRGIPVVLCNTIGWERSEYVKIELTDATKKCCSAVDANGIRLPSQVVGEYLYVYVAEMPAMGYKVIYLDEEAYTTVYKAIEESADFYEAETDLYHIEIKKSSGEIVSLYDKANRKYIVRKELVGWMPRNGVLNTLSVYNEAPTPMSSWSIGPVASIQNLINGAESSIFADGPLVKIIRVKHTFGKSQIAQDIIVYQNNPRIDFSTSVEWNETGDIDREAPTLRARFVPDIDNSKSTCEIPFGAVDRPCRDMEVPALKWIDISDEDYGFSLLNNCKYGHRIIGNAMEITLIRSGWEPDPASDVGHHEFVYSIFPHRAGWQESETIKEGYCLNNAIRTAFIRENDQGNLPDTCGFIEVQGKNVVISAFKSAEADDGFILRLYNGDSTEKEVTVNLAFEVNGICEVDLNENAIESVVALSGRSFQYKMSSFEIRTFKLFRKA